VPRILAPRAHRGNPMGTTRPQPVQSTVLCLPFLSTTFSSIVAPEVNPERISPANRLAASLLPRTSHPVEFQSCIPA